MAAVSCEDYYCSDELRFGDGHTLLWSLDRGLSFDSLWVEFLQLLAAGMPRDVHDIGVMLSSCEATHSGGHEARVWSFIAELCPLRRDVQEVVSGSTWGDFKPEAYIDKNKAPIGAFVARHGGHAQHKLAMLVQYVEAHVSRGGEGRPCLLTGYTGACASGKDIFMVDESLTREIPKGVGAAVLEAVVAYTKLKANYWLKVAAGQKGELIDEAIMRPSSSDVGSIRLEYGAYVGYSSLRLSGADADNLDYVSRVISFEVDPLHCCFARHLVNVAERAPLVEIWAGQAHGLGARCTEEFGGRAMALLFMDHRGTRFHSDLAQLVKQHLLQPSADILADNVLNPGAPAYLWEVYWRGSDVSTCAVVWSLTEFVGGGEGNTEDWTLVSCPRILGR